MDQRVLMDMAESRRYTRRDVLRAAGALGFVTAAAAVVEACNTALSPSPAATATAGASASAAPPSASPTQAALSVGSVTAAIGTGLDEGPYYVALSNGWWSDAGLEVKPTDPPSGLEAMNQVVAGQAFCGSIGSVVYFAAVATGLPVTTVSQDHGWSTQDNYASENIVASKASGIQAGDIAGLKGKKIGTRPGTDNEGGLVAFLSSAGLTEKDVTVVTVPPPQGAVALANGTVDAVCHIEPFASVALVTNDGAVLVTPDNPPVYMPGCTVVAKDFLAAHADVVKAFLAGHDRGMQVARQDPATMIQINQAYIPTLPVGAAFNALKKLKFDPRITQTVKDRMAKTTVPLYIQAGLLPAGTDAKTLVDGAFDTSISEQLQKEHPEYYSDLPPLT
jgi:ABC-type nitrate/sulfonate/bicarbonate transport system substrate-binding protein